MKSDKVKVYFCSLDEGWSRLQRLYVPQAGENQAAGSNRRLFYGNALQCALSFAEFLPAQLSPRFTSLIDYANKANSITGLEPIFLTFLNAASVVKSADLFNSGIACWTKFSAKRKTVADADFPTFYNVANRKLTFFDQKKFDSLRTGGANQNRLKIGPSLGAEIEALGLFTLSDPFRHGK